MLGYLRIYLVTKSVNRVSKAVNFFSIPKSHIFFFPPEGKKNTGHMKCDRMIALSGIYRPDFALYFFNNTIF